MELYKSLVKYIGKSLCQYYYVKSKRKKFNQLVKDTLKWENWKLMIQDMEKLEAGIEEKAQGLNLIASRDICERMPDVGQSSLWIGGTR
jgi:hypothetical protein